MRILEEASIGKIVLRNRIVMPPMNTELATERGEVTEKMIQHYSARAPWVGMVIVEHSYVRPDGKRSPRQLGIYDDQLKDGLSRLAKAVKETGARVAIQINHAGMKADAALIGVAPLGPSASNGARELAVEELKNLAEAFGEAARRAVSCGFDAVELHGAHGFLLNQFASPLTNRRNDDYGGSLEKRMRFPLEVVRRVGLETPSKVQLWYRLGADDRMAGGNSVEEGAKIAKLLAAEPVDVIDISGGLCGDSPAGLRGPGYFAYAARAVKDATGLPVVAVGGVKTVDQAESVLEKWGVDLVAVGKALLADPMWGKKA
jgi:NADPH2 dehydrogenase